MALFVLAVIIFVLADILLRVILKRMKEKKLREEREAALDRVRHRHAVVLDQ